MEKHVALLRRGRTGPVIRSLVSACLLCLLSHLPGFAAQSSQTATRPAEPRTPAKPPAARPNIVILLADDLGIGDVGYNGSKIRTPHIDKLAATGVRLNQFYAAPICSPARAALLTGRYPIRYGFQSALIWPWVEWGLGAEERTLAEALKQAGYRTALLGKWHLGHAREAYLPRRRGFDHHYGCYTGSVDYFEHTTNAALDWHRDGVPVEEEGYTTTLLAEEAVRLIRDSDHKRPLFLLVSFNAPHLPLQAPPGYRERYEHLKHPGRQIYAGMVTCMDEAIGQVVAALDDTGLRESTIVIFLSDNGAAAKKGGSNGPLRGGKGTPYEGALRVPAVVNWPGRLTARVVEAPLHIVDLYPTLLKLARAETEQGLPLDGLDMWATISKGGRSPHTELLLELTKRRAAIRRGDWKLVATREWTVRELYDLKSDPGEEIDVSSAHPETVAALLAALREYADQAAPAKKAGRLFPDGFERPKVWGPFLPPD